MDVELPTEITELIKSTYSGRVPLYAIATDVDDGGHPAALWLVITECEIAVADAAAESPDMPARILRAYPLGEIEGYRVTAEVGSGYLQICRGNVWVDLLRFTNSLARDFREVSDKLEHFRRSGKLELADELGPRRECPACGSRLPPHCDRCPTCVPQSRTFRRVVQLLRPFGWTTALIALLSIVAVAIELVPPLLQKVLVDRVLDGEHSRNEFSQLLGMLLAIVAGLAVVRLAAAGLAVWKANLSSRVGTQLTANLRTKMVEKLQQLSVSYHDRNQVGMLMSRVSYDTEAMHTFMHQLSGGFFLQLLQLIAIGVMLFVLNPKLAAFTLLPMPLVVIVSWVYWRYFYNGHHRYWNAVGRQAAALSSMLSGIRVVKAFTQESREHDRFRNTSERLRESRLGIDLASATFSSLIGLLFGLGGLIVWYVGGRDVLQDEMTLGSLMAFLAYLSMFYAPLTTLTESTTWISSFLTASQRIFELLDTPLRIDEPSHPEPVAQIRGHIRFQDVQFSYDESKTALSHVSFEVQPGESIGIVGRSGSGKSTLVCLISRLYDVDSGKVEIDGIDVRRISSRELRRRVGMVLQEPFLFEGTIAANIGYGNPNAPPERIIASAKAAAAHDFILRMPFSYETMLGERGAGLSGGERQRVSIARAVLYDPQILILDEATSSVDTESERLIQQAIERFSQGRTTLAIAHRLSTLENADRLLVLDRGVLAEQGTHEELLARRGLYWRLVEMQFGRHRSRLHDGQAEPDFEPIADDPPAAVPEIDPAEWQPRWLQPDEAHFSVNQNTLLDLDLDGRHICGTYAVRAFPASYSDEYISIRHIDAAGLDRELGLIRNLRDWPVDAQQLIRRWLNRRYLLRVVTGVISVRDDNGFINCTAETEDGEVKFTVQQSPANIKRFGYNGRLLTDIDDNHYLVSDIDMLPLLQRRLFIRHFSEC